MPSLRPLSPQFPHLPQLALCWETAASWPLPSWQASRTEWVEGKGPGIVLSTQLLRMPIIRAPETARTKPAVPVPLVDGWWPHGAQGGGGGV